MTEQWWHIVQRILLCWSLICLPFVRRDTNQTWAIEWFVFLFLSFSFPLYFLSFYSHTMSFFCQIRSLSLALHICTATKTTTTTTRKTTIFFYVLFFSFLHIDIFIYSIQSLTLRWKKEERKKGRTFTTTAIKFMYILSLCSLFFASVIFSISSH
jgi:hypothetical protein